MRLPAFLPSAGQEGVCRVGLTPTPDAANPQAPRGQLSTRGFLRAQPDLSLGPLLSTALRGSL